ncbi:coiled-coil domain-containing protein 9B isoform X2 [Corythoichthys intestinalis]|uniref:coiled-coil domain-containing protein 9B isoform X2 n=1 Tax=Corythoichthys intestinalis TaxID=161448 RepID=UPI0025A4D58C|nr:coiled-coil domain-containing protein 9B isoform X2 [Corythoichthys intestinalis]
MTPCNVTPRRDHERDLELDKKIEALRRKNEALMKRYKEVEEDKKRAEEDGMALLSRKGKADDLTITVNKSTSESRVVVTKSFNTTSPVAKVQLEIGAGFGKEISLQASGNVGRGHKKKLIVTMAGKKGKRVVCEKVEKMPDPTCLSDVKSPADEEQAGGVEAAGKPKQASHMTKLDNTAQELEITDLNIPTSKEEQEEYLQWKKEREKIDKERVARHKNAKGQWRRAWDIDKTENMFLDKSVPDRDWVPPPRGGRSPRRVQHRSGADPGGHEKRGKDKSTKNLQVMGSNAKGKDRLTGRARRWQDQVEVEGDNLQTSDVPSEEFLEKFDALTDAEEEEQRDQDSKTRLLSPDILNPCEIESGSKSSSTLRADTSVQNKADASPHRTSEKKVRFSQELIQGAHTKQITGSQDSASSSESSQTCFVKASLQKKNQHEVPRQFLESAKEDEESHWQQQASESECTKKDISAPTAACGPLAEKVCASPLDCSVQSVDLANINTDEPNDPCVCVLSLESGESHPELFSCTDKFKYIHQPSGLVGVQQKFS